MRDLLLYFKIANLKFVINALALQVKPSMAG